ncbi:DUF397 domain-containing protein [Micromonospora sp. NBC_01796]|uniref:DUF397 domain-containing protein n=1 Tax=Micromonospora sp. NBC_01796 TaxID=2975987 RepID=UPI002DD95836|nr:DUF397 domain-containing protein [Micromonospora sp. NBC_01796]WSA87141.1 DUF397 domain-containing protein [Micromonospora sp. NBC_01796]
MSAPTTTTMAAFATAAWRKSSRSGDQGACVEFAVTTEAIGVRDSKDPGGPILTFPATAWSAFAGAVPTGPIID